MEEKFRKIGIIIIGNEILKGHVKDLNSGFLCKRLHAIGTRVCRVTVVPDEINDIAEEVARFSQKYDIVITTGGIGPTHDDITYEAIAQAMGDKIILHSEMAEVINTYFQGGCEIESNPALKMALIPQTSKLIYVLPKTEELRHAGKHNGLQSEKPQPPKKSFPIVQVKNVYVLPGAMEWLEHAFNHLQKIFENQDVNIHTMVMFLKTSEMRILKELNQAVAKYENHVIFGSYPSDSSNELYKTKITLEATSVDDVTSAYKFLKSILPNECINTDLQLKDAELVYELTNGTRSLSMSLRHSLKVIETAFKEYKSEEIYLSFNGGKDCTVLLHLVWAVGVKMSILERLNTIHIKSDQTFPEVEEFISKTVKKYKLNMVTIYGAIKEALTKLHKDKPNIKAIFMGTRRTDPYSNLLQEFQMCDKDWPPLMRVNPILDWSYEDVWDFLRLLDISYCKLYDEGYTSIGNPANTLPNPALRVSRTQDKYLPAYKLKNGSLERQGRK